MARTGKVKAVVDHLIEMTMEKVPGEEVPRALAAPASVRDPFQKFFRILASRTGVEPVSPP